MLALVRMVFIAVLWTASLLLLILRTYLHESSEAAVLSAWSIWLGLVAALTTAGHIGACLLNKERAHLLAVAQLAASACVESQQELRSVD